MRVMNQKAAAIIQRAQQLLWVVLRSDVENLASQRRRALGALHDLELQASEVGIPDLYRQVLTVLE